jgi:large subunit ribosomal protein L25
MDVTLNAETRDTRGKNEARRLRKAGRIPAVVYGGADAGSLAIAVDPKALGRILHSESGANTLITLTVGDQAPAKVLVKDYLLDPIRHSLLHADFYRVAMDKPITVTVPVQMKGEARGVKVQGGVLDFVTRDVEIECLPGDIPEHLDVDVTDLLIGQSVRLRDLAVTAKWKPVTDPDVMLVHVVPTRVAAPEPEAAVAAAPVATSEPEVIKKGKAEKGEE